MAFEQGKHWPPVSSCQTDPWVDQPWWLARWPIPGSCLVSWQWLSRLHSSWDTVIIMWQFGDYSLVGLIVQWCTLWAAMYVPVPLLPGMHLVVIHSNHNVLPARLERANILCRQSYTSVALEIERERSRECHIDWQSDMYMQGFKNQQGLFKTGWIWHGY